MTPCGQEETWQAHWQKVPDRLNEISRPRPEPISGAAIKQARQELLDFFVFAYHLRDRLQHDGAISEAQGRVALQTSPDLALLADLCNLVKHAKIDRKIWSGAAPVIGKAHGDRPGAGGGWVVGLDITHAGRQLEGLAFARDAVAAWDDQLRAWGLI